MIVSLRIAEKSSYNAPPKNMFIAKFATTTALEAFPTAAVAAARVAACEGSSCTGTTFSSGNIPTSMYSLLSALRKYYGALNATSSESL